MTIDNSIFNRLSQTLGKVIIGQPTLIEQLLVALLSGGHVIIEGVPGTGKTLTVKVLSKLIKADFRRVQLTPDILPSDILGTNIFDLTIALLL
jgi:MoxR-like ATPase